MTDRDDLVARVLTQARIAGAARRRAVERELRDHIEDAAAELRAAGCADEQLADRVAEQFGDPGEIAHAFEETYSAERVVANALLWSGQLVVSFLAAAAVIATVQLLSAVLRRVGVASVFAQFKMETIGFAALASGYVASCWVERMLQRKSALLRVGAY